MGFVICFQVHWSPIPSCILLGFQFLDRYHPFAGPYAGGAWPWGNFQIWFRSCLGMSWQRQVIVQSPSNSPGFDPFNSNSWSRWLRPLWLINCLDLSQAAVDPTCRIPSSYLSSTSWDFMIFMYTERKQLISVELWGCSLKSHTVRYFRYYLPHCNPHTGQATLQESESLSTVHWHAHPQRIPISVVAAPRNCSRFTFDMAWRHSRNRVRSTVNMSHAHTHPAPDRILNPSISIISEEIMYWASLATEWLFCLSQPATAFAALRRQAPSESLQNLQRAFSVTNRVDGQAGDRLVLRYAFSEVVFADLQLLSFRYCHISSL
jgi:hypothetical protein